MSKIEVLKYASLSLFISFGSFYNFGSAQSVPEFLLENQIKPNEKKNELFKKL